MAALSAERYLAHEGLIREFHQAPDAAEPMVAVASPAAAAAAVRYDYGLWRDMEGVSRAGMCFFSLGISSIPSVVFSLCRPLH